MPGRLTTNGHALDRRAGRRAGDASPARTRRRAGAAPRAARRRCAARSCSAPPTRRRSANELRTALAEARQGRHLDPAPPSAAALRAPERIAIDYADGDELAAKAEHRAAARCRRGNPAAWTALRARGIFRGSGAPGKVAFLYTGQGSQYANMLADLRGREPIVADVFDEADAIMTPAAGGARACPTSSSPTRPTRPPSRAPRRSCAAPRSPSRRCSPSTSRSRGCWRAYGIAPGHRHGPLARRVRRARRRRRAVVRGRARGGQRPRARDGEPDARGPRRDGRGHGAARRGRGDRRGDRRLRRARQRQLDPPGRARRRDRGRRRRSSRRCRSAATRRCRCRSATPSTPRSSPRRASRCARRSSGSACSAPQLPIVANVDGELYPTGDGVEEQMLDILARQVASPVQFVKGLRTLYDAGARVFVEVGPKRALQGFAADVLGDDDVLSLATNHPKPGDVVVLQPGAVRPLRRRPGRGRRAAAREAAALRAGATAQRRAAGAGRDPPRAPEPPRRRRRPRRGDDELGRLFAEFLERGRELMRRRATGAPRRDRAGGHHRRRARAARAPSGSSTTPTSAACSTASRAST